MLAGEVQTRADAPAWNDEDVEDTVAQRIVRAKAKIRDAARADLCRRLGKHAAARTSYERALADGPRDSSGI